MEEIKYLLLTIVIEAPVALVFLRTENWQRVFFIVVCVNLISHPIAWQLVAHGYSWWAVEALVAIFEGLVLAFIFTTNRYRAGLAGLIMNAVSALVGLII